MSFSGLLTAANAAGTNPRLIFVTVALAFFIYKCIQRWREFQVRFPFLPILL
jgi:hypothetical protein